MASTAASKHLDLLGQLLDRAKRSGAETADALVFQSESLAFRQRLGKPEMLERSESQDLGLRVLIGKRQAIVSSTDLSERALSALVERAVAMARAAPEDKYCGVADSAEIARTFPDLDLADPDEPEPQALIDRAAAAEAAALLVPGVTNSEGAESGWSRTSVALAATNGFAAGYVRTGNGISVSVLAGQGTAMETDYDQSSAVFARDLEDAALVGRRAGEKAVKRLNPRKAETASVAVVFDPRIANSILGHLGGAISGPAIARGTSFLKDKLGQRLFASGIHIVDDPLRPRGLRSRPFDGEGIGGRRQKLVDDGVLTTWVLDLASARQLGLRTTGHAARGTSGPPGPSCTNLYLEPGPLTPEALMADIKQGFYVTGLMGFGVNNVTGDYSRGANGFWIENGEQSYPVSEVTIAGNLTEMFRNLTPASDLVFRYGANAPTLRIDGMTVAGR
ncbi:MAG: TldD/PmbA family protein [Proteobacteria bacterium]|nr:TldD/PmbA family protein [Pseudomonadota bacterium]MBI3496846.1 TldD/PmbA family protein [Pseudomonadota bacterium]